MTRYKIHYYVKDGAIKAWELSAETWEIENDNKLLVFYDENMEFIEAFVLHNILGFEKRD